MIILGLDISTANVGYSLVESGSPQSHRLIKANSLSIHTKDGLYQKAAYTRECLINELKDYKVDVIIIEESLKSFKKRSSSPTVIALLNRFNGMISFIVRDAFNAPVHFVSATSARKKVGIVLVKELDTKEQIFEWVKNNNLMKDYQWPTKKLKSGPRKNQEVFEARCYDISDAFVMSFWGCNHLKNQELNYTIC